MSEIETTDVVPPVVGWDAVRTYLWAFVRSFVILNLAVGWTVLWGAIARLLYIKGELTGVAIVVVAMLLPVIGWTVYRFASVVGLVERRPIGG